MAIPDTLTAALTALDGDAQTTIAANAADTQAAAALTAAQTNKTATAQTVVAAVQHQATDLTAAHALLDQLYGPGGSAISPPAPTPPAS